MVQLKHCCCQQCQRLLSFCQIATGGIQGCLCSTYKSGVAEFDLQKEFLQNRLFFDNFSEKTFSKVWRNFRQMYTARHPYCLVATMVNIDSLTIISKPCQERFLHCIFLSCPNHSNSSHPDVVTWSASHTKVQSDHASDHSSLAGHLHRILHCDHVLTAFDGPGLNQQRLLGRAATYMNERWT